MATDKPRFSITVGEDMLKEINDYKDANKFSTQSKAVVDLIGKGIREIMANEESPPPGETGSGPEAPEGYEDLTDDHKKFVKELIQFLITKQ